MPGAAFPAESLHGHSKIIKKSRKTALLPGLEGGEGRRAVLYTQDEVGSSRQTDSQ